MAHAIEGFAQSAPDGISLHLRYKVGWSPAQIAAADAKVATLDAAAHRGELSVTQVERSLTSAASTWRRAGNAVPAGADIDHTIELQLGGADELGNMNPLDYSVNRSIGAQIMLRVRGLDVGSPIRAVSISYQ